jgi:hypothetical protein
MQRLLLYKKIADQFRQEEMAYPGFAEEQNNNLLFRKFAGRDDDMKRMGKAIEEMLDDEAANKAMQQQLEQKNIPDALRLASIVRSTYREFHQYVQHEPYMDHYFRELMDMLQLYAIVMGVFRHKLDELPEQLFTPDAHELKTDLDVLMDDIRGYYQYFYERFDEELDRSREGAFTIPVELYLLQLLSYTEAVLCSYEQLDRLWEKRQARLSGMAKQTLYN